MQFTNATTVIDSIQDAKVKVLKNLITEQAFLKPLVSIVEAEAALAKATVKAIEDAYGKIKLA